MSRVASLRTVNWLAETIRRHKAGEPVGIYSVCSAHPTVVQAAIAQAAADGSRVLIEATSNQVDQFGGYTGLRPAEFRDLVFGIADASGFARERVVLGGNHLGPNRWQRQSASAAMANAEVLIAAYVEAGYTKIHLDCSMACPDDPTVLTDEIVAGRAARLLRVAAHRAAFAELGLEHVWPRVVALVVQPGVEFDHLNVIDYERSATTELRHVLDTEEQLVFEA